MADEPGTSKASLCSSRAAADDGNEDSVVSLSDVLQEEQDLEEDANAVLGDSNDTHCTYEEGYKLRQAVYSCKTCSSTDDEPAGVCLACSLQCHESHELVELYTKRNFRCDCGNSKFPAMKCSLFSDKEARNDLNSYNQNFRGLYCTCNKPYPDPQDDIEDLMIQCCICEDWYHGRHVGRSVPQEYGEFICEKCMQKNAFLYTYTALFPQMTENGCTTVNEGSTAEGDVSVEVTPSSSAEVTPSSSAELTPNNNEATKAASTSRGSVEQTDETDKECKVPGLKAALGLQADQLEATFWPDEWRSKLCKCKECKALLEDKNISFLYNTEDSISAYELRGRSRGRLSQYENGLQALQQMDRVQQIEVISEFNSMKDNLKDYLKKFAENKKVVREEDIQEFFEEMKSRKKPKTDMPYYCK